MSYVVAAYSIIFAGILLFSWSLFRRQKKLEKKLSDLKEELREVSKR